MYNWDKVMQCVYFQKDSKGKPVIMKPQYIILHHTASENFKGDVRYLSGPNPRSVSVHFVIGRNPGECYKISEPTYVTYHAGPSQWGNTLGMNQCSLGIEFTGIDKFTDWQYAKGVEVIRYLMKVFNIPLENVLKHADIAWEGGKQKKLWDGKTPSRKTDINRSFWADRGYGTFAERRLKVLK